MQVATIASFAVLPLEGVIPRNLRSVCYLLPSGSTPSNAGRIIRNDEVVGSIPTSSTKFSSTCDHEDPAKDALRLLHTARENGEVCLIDPGEYPKPLCTDNSILLGWKETDEDGAEVWLAQPDTLFKFISDHYEKQGKSFPWDRKTLLERWAQNEYTKTNERNLYKMRISGEQQRVVYIFPSAFVEVFEEDKNSQVAHTSVIPSRKTWLRDDSVVPGVPTVPTLIPSLGNAQATDATRVN
jgi:hypothetical protein